MFNILLFNLHVYLILTELGSCKPIEKIKDGKTSSDLIQDDSSFKSLDDYKNIELPSVGENSDLVGFEHGYYFNSTNNGSGNYYFSSETEESKRSEIGELKNKGQENEILVIKGKYTEETTDSSQNKHIRTIGYIANENGFQPFLINSSLIEFDPQKLHEKRQKINSLLIPLDTTGADEYIKTLVQKLKQENYFHFRPKEDYTSIETLLEEDSTKLSSNGKDFKNDGAGTYTFRSSNFGYLPYSTAVEVKHKGTESEALTIRGEYSERFKENILGIERDIIRNVGYVADEKGFQPFIKSYGIKDHTSEKDYKNDSPLARFQKEVFTHFKSLEDYKNVDLSKTGIFNSTNKEVGQNSFSFQTDSYNRTEKIEEKNGSLIVTGNYSDRILDKDQNEIIRDIAYIADEKGFQPFILGYRLTYFDDIPEYVIIPGEKPHFDSKRLQEEVSAHYRPIKKYENIKLPLEESDNSTAIKLNTTVDHSGNYYFSFNTDGYKRSESTEIKNKGTENEILVVKGRYTETIKNERGDDVIREIGYIADENGFQPFVINSDVVTKSPKKPSSIILLEKPRKPDACEGGGCTVGAPKGKGIGSSYIAASVGNIG